VRKPGNAGGAKGPWFKVSAGSGKNYEEIGDEPIHSGIGSEAASGAACQSEGIAELSLICFNQSETFAHWE
jgi:hypothetical protein